MRNYKLKRQVLQIFEDRCLVGEGLTYSTIYGVLTNRGFEIEEIEAEMLNLYREGIVQDNKNSSFILLKKVLPNE